MKKIIATALLTAIAAISTQASATPVALNGSMGTTTLSNNTYSATFSGKSFLPQDYQINALTFSFSFKDDNDTWTTSAPLTTSTRSTAYSYAGFSIIPAGLVYSRDVTVDQSVTRTGQQEGATLSLAGIQVGNGATAFTESSSTVSSSQSVYDGKDCGWLSGYYFTDVTTNTTTLTDDWSGPFTISGAVTNQQILNQLLQDDQLQVSLIVKGDLVLTDAKVMLDYTKINASQVPEPSSIMLALAGLGGLGYARRRRAGARK